jgi:hypothetical protein
MVKVLMLISLLAIACVIVSVIKTGLTPKKEDPYHGDGISIILFGLAGMIIIGMLLFLA